MNDTVKLIIEIPKEAYKMCQDLKKYDDGIVGPIAKGIPLDDVKAEFINRYPKNFAGEPELGGYVRAFSLNMVLKILDNIGKAESEDKE